MTPVQRQELDDKHEMNSREGQRDAVLECSPDARQPPPSAW